jgi:hypothetical protein
MPELPFFNLENWPTLFLPFFFDKAFVEEV